MSKTEHARIRWKPGDTFNKSMSTGCRTMAQQRKQKI